MRSMVTLTVNFLTLLLAALLVGAMFAVWLIFNPRGLDATAYVSLQQQGIRALSKASAGSGDLTLPTLGAITTALTFTAAVLARTERARLTLLLVAAALFVVAGLVTREYGGGRCVVRLSVRGKALLRQHLSTPKP